MAEKKEATVKRPVIEKVPVFIPKTGKGDDERYIAVNGRRILVKTGQTVMLEKKFAEVIANSQASDEAAARYIESVAND